MAFLRANPYAPSEGAAADAAARARIPRAAALLATLFGGALIAGAGLLALGRPRRFLGWLSAGLIAVIFTLVAGLAGAPRLMFSAIAAALLVTLGALVDTARVRPGTQSPPMPPWLLVVVVAAIAGGGGLLLRTSLVENFAMPSGSMMPPLLVGYRFLVNKVSRSVKRGDVVVFTHPTKPGVEYVKR